MLSAGCAHVGPSRAHVEPSWAHLGLMLGQVGPMLSHRAHLEPIWQYCANMVGAMIAWPAGAGHGARVLAFGGNRKLFKGLGLCWAYVGPC